MPPVKLLCVKPSSFGDIVHLFPALAALRQLFPDGVLDFVVNPEFSGLLDFSPFPVRRTIIFERRKLGCWSTALPELWRLIRDIRAEKYDYAVDFQGLFRSSFCVGVSRAAHKCGFAEPRERSGACFYDRKVSVPPGHAVERLFRLADGLFTLPCPLTQPDLPEVPVELPPLPERYTVLLPGTRWTSKRFPPAFFADLADRLRKLRPGMGIVVCGGRDEIAVGEAIGGGVINLAGRTTIPQLFAVLRRAVAVAGNDSGPLHAAAALKVPVFGFYGPTDPVLTGPWGENVQVYTAGVACQPCLRRECPDGSYRCRALDLKRITEEITQKIGE